MKRVGKFEWEIFCYLRGLRRINGWLRIRVKKLAEKFKCSARTILRRLRKLKDAELLSSFRRGRAANEYSILSPPVSHRSVTSKPVHIRKEPREIAPTEIQHHRDDAESLPEIARKAAGMERLSEGDRRWLGSLGTPGAQVRAGIILGRARKLASATAKERVYSIRYFASAIAEAVSHPAGYIEHCANFLRRHGAA